jgi:hypothetical protein
VEWLVDVSVKVNQQSKGKRLAFNFWLYMLHDCLVCNCRFIIFIFIKPTLNSRKSHRNVFEIRLNVEIRDWCVVVNEWLIIKVPAGLPASSTSFWIVCPSNTLYKWVIFLITLSNFITILL